GFSKNYKSWFGGGYSEIHNKQSGVRINIVRGSYYAHQMLMGFHFDSWKLKYWCDNNGTVYYRYKAGPTKCLFDWKQGADISKYDGYWPYQDSNQNYRKRLQPDEEVQITKGRAYH